MKLHTVRRVAALGLLTCLPLAVGCSGSGPSSPSKTQCAITYGAPYGPCVNGQKTHTEISRSPAGCSATPTPSEACTSVTTTFSVYNAATGRVGSFTQTAEAGTQLSIDVNIAGVKGVDPNFIVAREPSTSELGAFITETTNGTLTYTMSASRANVHLWFFENTNGEDYGCMHTSGVGKTLAAGKRNVTARPFRLDEVPYPGMVLISGPPHVWTGTGPDGVPGAIDQIQAAMNPFGVSYYGVDVVNANASADIRFGFGAILGYPYSGLHGWPPDNWATVNLPQFISYIGQRGVAIAEFSEVIYQTDDPCEAPSTATLQYSGSMTTKGKNILRWAAIFTPK